jgi:hypothetical protein
MSTPLRTAAGATSATMDDDEIRRQQLREIKLLAKGASLSDIREDRAKRKPNGSFGSDQGRRSSETEWPEPKPIPNGLLPVAPFNHAFLPVIIAPWVMDIAERMQCAPDFVGIPATIALGSIIGRNVGIRPQRKTDWLEVPNLWGCIVGRPGVLTRP